MLQDMSALSTSAFMRFTEVCFGANRMERSAEYQQFIQGCVTSTGHGMALPEYGQPTLFGLTTQKLTQKPCDTFFKHGKSQSESFGLGESTSLLH
jgi:hypothetical protein